MDKPKKVLIVEDDRFFSNRLAELLNDQGLDSVVVNNAQSALKQRIANFSAVLIDVMLPNSPRLSGISEDESRGGYETGIVLARLLGKKNSKVPMILMSQGICDTYPKKWSDKQKVIYISKIEGQQAILNVLQKTGIPLKPQPPKSFIVHGHDEKTLTQLKKYIVKKLKWQPPVVLRDAPNQGKTIIEKFEEHASKVDWVFVLMTPDDRVLNAKTNHAKRRARQNVIFELGFFYAQFGRKSGRVIVLHKGSTELPSDIHGIVWIDISHGFNAADSAIKREVFA